MKEATMLLIEVAASLTEIIQGSNHSVSNGDVNIGGMPSILPRQFHEKINELSFQNRQDLEFDNEGGDDVPN